MTLLELREAHVAPERGVEVHLEPGATLHQPLDVLVDDVGREPEGRDPPDHHAPQAVRHLVDVHRVAGDAQVVRGDQPGWARAHDADALLPRDRRRGRAVRRSELVHHEALQVPDLHRAVPVDTPAGGLARGVAYPPADGAEGVGRRDRLERSLVVLAPDVGDVGRRVGADRTGNLRVRVLTGPGDVAPEPEVGRVREGARATAAADPVAPDLRLDVDVFLDLRVPVLRGTRTRRASIATSPSPPTVPRDHRNPPPACDRLQACAAARHQSAHHHERQGDSRICEHE